MYEYIVKTTRTLEYVLNEHAKKSFRLAQLLYSDYTKEYTLVMERKVVPIYDIPSLPVFAEEDLPPRLEDPTPKDEYDHMAPYMYVEDRPPIPRPIGMDPMTGENIYAPRTSSLKPPVS